MTHNQQAEKKKAYQLPKLRSYGNITQLTLNAAKAKGMADDENSGKAQKFSTL